MGALTKGIDIYGQTVLLKSCSILKGEEEVPREQVRKWNISPADSIFVHSLLRYSIFWPFLGNFLSPFEDKVEDLIMYGFPGCLLIFLCFLHEVNCYNLMPSIWLITRFPLAHTRRPRTTFLTICSRWYTSCPPQATSHGAVVNPKPRNGLEGNIAPWNGQITNLK